MLVRHQPISQIRHSHTSRIVPVGEAVSGPAESRVDMDFQDARMNCFVARCLSPATPDCPDKTRRRGSHGSTSHRRPCPLTSQPKIIYKPPKPCYRVVIRWVHYERRYSTYISRTTTRSKHRVTKPRGMRGHTNQDIDYHPHLTRLPHRHHLRLPLHRRRRSYLDPESSSCR